jgi:hypothetical protein
MTNHPINPHPRRTLPVRPNLTQLRHQAKDLLRLAIAGDPGALSEFQLLSAPLKLSGAQMVLARSYGAASWTRLVQACAVADAIWEDEPDRLRDLILKSPKLLDEPVRVQPDNWGSPMSYAANLGRESMIAMLRGLGATDVQRAFVRACLQGQISAAKKLRGMGAEVEPGMVMGPCETLNPDGLEFLLESGGKLADANGDPLAPIGLLLQTYTRNPAGKRRCLALAAERGVEFPDTPPMAVHRGRIDLLKELLRRDPKMLTRQFAHEEIFPTSLGCSGDPSEALHGTPLDGATLLHIAVDYDERDVIHWLLAEGAPVDGLAAVDSEGFGSHTALFGTIVNQPYRASRPGSEEIAGLLLAAGADKSIRASLRKRLRFVEDETLHEYRDVTPREWGERFHDQDWVNPAALALV